MSRLKLSPEGSIADLKKHIETSPINPHKVVSIKTKGSKLIIVERFKNVFGETVTGQKTYNKRLKLSNFYQQALSSKILKRTPFRKKR